jgi:hypothetical protein
MKKMYTIKNALLLLAFMLFTLLAGAEEVKKTYSESYQVNADAEVYVSNEYGNVNIESWEKNQVMIDITVKVDGKSKEDAAKIIDKVDVSISGSDNSVKVIAKLNGNLKCKNCDFSINCMVKMPMTNKLVLKNTFGNVDIDDLNGATDIYVSYGSMTLGNFSSKENKIELKYGDAEIAMLKAADLDMAYGAIEIGKAGYLDLYARFAGIEIGEVSELMLDAEYESTEIGSVDILRGKTSFHGIEIDELFDKLDITASYGEIEVTRVSVSFSLIDVSNEFGEISLGISNSASYSLDASVSFGDLDFPESNTEIIRKQDENFKSSVEAFIGDDKSSQSKVILRAKNGEIKIY